MMDRLLQTHLDPIARGSRRWQLWRNLALCWAVAALAGLAALLAVRSLDWSSGWTFLILAVGTAVAAAIIVRRFLTTTPDYRAVARQIEEQNPELHALLLTAVEQRPDSATGELNYLQHRLVSEALSHDQKYDWSEVVPESRINLARMGHWLALVLFLFVLWGLRATGGHDLLARIPGSGSGITVTPGDTSLERGSSLVILARFRGTLPANVNLVIGENVDSGRRISLAKSLADPIFGGSIPEVSSNLVYRIEYGDRRSRDFTVAVFDYPRVERADADLSYPEYTKQPPKRIENTKRVTAVEGSRVDFTLQLNKPVTSARLIGKEKGTAIVLLHVETNRAVAKLKDFPLETSKTYQLQLIDADGRTNKVPAQFVFEVLKNRAPELRLASPRGDIRPSPLEEISFEGTVWDDFGIKSYGLGYSVAGQEPKTLELGHDVPGKEKRSFQQMLRLEDLGVQPDQLVAWFVWADDVGPDGKVRRTAGDLFFGEVRPFEEVFREGQGMEGQGQSGQQKGNQSAKLAELQKQIINATWKLKRDYGTAPARESRPSPEEGRQSSTAPASSSTMQTARLAGSRGKTPALIPAQNQFMGSMAQFAGQRLRLESSSDPDKMDILKTRKRLGSQGKAPSYQEDIVVVRDAQAQAIEQAEAALERQEDPRTRSLWLTAIKEMKSALTKLDASTNSPPSLGDALAAQQAAFQAFLKLEQHEYQVVRNRNQSQGGGGREQQMQRQLEQMDLTQSENRYETQRQAQAPQNTERREALQVMNRLQELARRQQDLNERLKELQTALQEARTEAERDDIRRRLKRLQEEEQQMLADVDELRQRMDRPENQSRMNEERRQLDETRNDVQRASEAASQGAASQALASGTRAQQQLQDMREQMRKENSSQFADDARELRAEARELSRQQEEILKKIEADSGKERKALSESPERKEMSDQLERQKEKMTNLVDRATQVSQQSEEAEPLLSRQLYDTLRKFTQDNGKNFKETQDELLNRGLLSPTMYERLKKSSESDGVKLLDVSSEMLRQDFLPQARDTSERARAGMENLKRGVERAAEGVLGDDTEALRLAREELNRLTEQLQKEMDQAEGNSASNIVAGTSNQRAGRTASDPKEGQSKGNGKQGGASESADKQTAEQQNAAGNEQASDGEGKQQPTQVQADQPGQGGQSQGADRAQTTQKDGERRTASGRNNQGQNARSGRPESGSTGGEGGGAGGNFQNEWDRLLTDTTRQLAGPLTGDGFGPWSDRLRDIEDMVELPELRNGVAQARERARVLRQGFKRDLKKPDWAVVQLQVMKPLIEVQDRISEELSRRQSSDSLVPIDRDPVPNRYSDLVRRYYEELGKDATR